MKKVLLIDVRKAHLHADAVREVYVELPPGLQEKFPGMWEAEEMPLWHPGCDGKMGSIVCVQINWYEIYTRGG